MSSLDAVDKHIERSKRRKKINKILKRPLTHLRHYLLRSYYEKEGSLLLKDEKMVEDLERYLMELEEQRSWLAYELNHLNYERLKKVNILQKLLKKKNDEIREKNENYKKEVGGILSFQGNFQEFEKYKNSSAKYRDFIGHKGAVTCCKLSQCQNWILTGSEDQTIKIWTTREGECKKTMIGHTKIVNDLDLHPFSFKLFSKEISLISVSGDGTLRFWNTSDTVPQKTIEAHKYSAYKCLFSPNGSTIVTCSEDKTIKTWSFPDGYNIYIYKGHLAPVTAISYSPTGKYLASGSDYGERKIFLWNAREPNFTDPSYFSHYIFWTPEGMIKKILLRREVPKTGFWLSLKQRAMLKNEALTDSWIGELSEDDESEEEEEDVDEEEDEEVTNEKLKNKLKQDILFSNDLHALAGTTLSVSTTGEYKPKKITEYIPGSSLIFSIQSYKDQISDLFISVSVKETRFDIFSQESGMKVGLFDLESPILWQPTYNTIDDRGNTKLMRKPPPGFTISKDNISFVYKYNDAYDDYFHSLNEFTNNKQKKLKMLADLDDESLKEENGEEKEEKNCTSTVDVVWKCPQQGVGSLVVIANFRLKGDTKWRTLRYSLKESLIRLNHLGEVITDDKDDRESPFKFDQTQRHQIFWDYVRDKDWKSVASFLNNNVKLYMKYSKLKKKFRIINLLADIFERASWIILYSPFEFTSGVTKSTVLCDSHFKEAHEEDGDDESVDDFDLKSDSYVDDYLDEEDDKKVIAGPKVGEQDEEDDEPQEQIEEGLDGEIKISRGIYTSLLEQVKERPKTKPQTFLPYILLKDPTSKEFKMKVDKILRDEITYILKALELLADCVTEIGFTRINDKFLQVMHEYSSGFLKEILSRPRELIIREVQLLMEEMLSKQESLALGIGHKTKSLKKFSNKRSNIANALDHSIIRSGHFGPDIKDFSMPLPVNYPVNALDHSIIRRGHFGPDIKDFSMPLPVNYPVNAGVAKNAISPSLMIYEDFLLSRNIQTMPTSLAEVYEPSLRETFFSWFQHWRKTAFKHFKVKLESIIVQEIEIRVAALNSYFAMRRLTYTSLPGLDNTNPNVNCTQFPVLPSDIITENQNFQMSNLQERKIVTRTKNNAISLVNFKPQIIPSVGRKPSPEDIEKAADNQAHFNPYNFVNNPHYPHYKKVQYAVDILDNLVINHIEKKKAKFRLFGIFRNKSRKKGSAMERDHSFNLKMLDQDHTDLYHYLKKSRREEVKYRRQMHKKGVTIAPSSAYMERRFFYPILPGHEDFVDDAAYDLIKMREEKRTSLNLSDDKRNQALVNKGLIRVFKFNGFEIAHHGGVNDLTFSPSETRIATAGGDKLIKIWDPRDGSFVKSLVGHEGEVLSIRYTQTEQYLVSCGSDRQIIIWSLITQTIQRILKGHCDVIYSLSISSDASLIVSASHDTLIKSWYTTPDKPDRVETPDIISISDTTVMLNWSPPPAFNCDINAYHYQYRVTLNGEWQPPQGKSSPPQLTTYTITGLIPATPYQVRICAENAMGRGLWSLPTPLFTTEFGLPLVPEKLSIIRKTSRSLFFVWFTHNPSTFGSASKKFEVQCSGDGKGFEENPTLSLTLEEVTYLGNTIKQYIRNIHKRYLEMSGKLIRSQLFGIHNRQSPEDREKFPISREISHEALIDMFNRFEDQNYLFAAGEYPHLNPGHDYILRIRGENVAGFGEWSDTTSSHSTLPTPPSSPSTPVIFASTLRSLTFKWNPPTNDGGSAITGYRIRLFPGEKEVDLPRSTISYTWDGLFPGRSYFIQVKAYNEVGSSPFSERNHVQDSFTQTAPPETPSNPIAIAGTWNTLTYEVDIPYHNGSPVTSMGVEYRSIAPFMIGNWVVAKSQGSKARSRASSVNLDIENNNIKELLVSPQEIDNNSSEAENFAKQKEKENNIRLLQARHDATYILDKDTTVVKYVDIEKQQNDMEDKVKQLEALKLKQGGFSNKTESMKLKHEIEELINSQKPSGSRISFSVVDLQQDTMYEIRVRFVNVAGVSQFSTPSHRAKTNKALPPDPCTVPTIVSFGKSYVILEISIPKEGGCPIRLFTIEILNLEENITTVSNHSFSEPDFEDKIRYRIQGLVSNNSYIFRCKGESEVGPGGFSPWTQEVKLP